MYSPHEEVRHTNKGGPEYEGPRKCRDAAELENVCGGWLRTVRGVKRDKPYLHVEMKKRNMVCTDAVLQEWIKKYADAKDAVKQALCIAPHRLRHLKSSEDLEEVFGQSLRELRTVKKDKLYLQEEMRKKQIVCSKHMLEGWVQQYAKKRDNTEWCKTVAELEERYGDWLREQSHAGPNQLWEKIGRGYLTRLTLREWIK